MFGLGMGEWLVIAVVALLFLGPDKLPEAAKKFSKTLRELRGHSRDLKKAIKEDESIGSVVSDIESAIRDTEIHEPSHPTRPSRRSRDQRESANDQHSPPPESEGKPDDESSPPRSERELEESTVAQKPAGRNYENVNVRFYLAAEGSSLAGRLTVDLAHGVSQSDGTFVAKHSKTLRVMDSEISTFEEGDAETLRDLLVKLYDETGWPAP
jgi:Tat protein translocase TatB subunit